MMMVRGRLILALLALVMAGASALVAGERVVVSLTGFCETELKSAGFELRSPVVLHIKALGAGGDAGWKNDSDRLFAYGWIIDATTRQPVWKMSNENTTRSRDDRSFDGEVRLDKGSYEAYFTVPVFAHHTVFTHINTNIDHRGSSLFGNRNRGWFYKFFEDWFGEDVSRDWKKRCSSWGMEISVQETTAPISTFTPPRQLPRVLVSAIGLGEQEHIRKGFSLVRSTPVTVYAIGEGVGKGDLVDYGWIVDAATRKRVWEMDWKNLRHAGGAEKNLVAAEEIHLHAGDYVLYYVTDDSHSPADWNDSPPYDPMHWGITLSARDSESEKNFTGKPYAEITNPIVAITKVGDNESKSAGFTLRKDARLRVYALGERVQSRRQMVDYGFIMDARTRSKVWTMDVDKSYHAGGASKNRYVDEIISLPAGNYVVVYNSDDSHAYGDWNASPPFDQENYGITVMGAGDGFSPAIVERYVEQRDKNILAQIVTVRNDEERTERFRVDSPTRVRVYALGEGMSRQLYDYGWIEDARTGERVWEMTYGMTFHAGGNRKNRKVNTTMMLDKGEYILHYVSDDSHCYNSWNVDPPDDQEYWGITVYRDTGEIPGVPKPPSPPRPGG